MKTRADEIQCKFCGMVHHGTESVCENCKNPLRDETTGYAKIKLGNSFMCGWWTLSELSFYEKMNRLIIVIEYKYAGAPPVHP